MNIKTAMTLLFSAFFLRDGLTGASLTLQLAAQHAAIAVIGRKEKAVIAKYGF